MTVVAEAPAPPPDPGVRVGQGLDVHPFGDVGAEARPLVLGGVILPGERPLEGHSDADVLLHAIADAVLGAAALGDLGGRFGTSDPRRRGASSARFVEDAVEAAAEAGWAVGNIDCTVVGERPRVAPHREAIRASVARTCRVPLDRVSVKATTTDGLGALGRAEGVAALATVLLVRRL